MDKELKALLQQSMEERAQTIYSQMRQSTPELEASIKQVAALSVEVEACLRMNQEGRRLVQRFLEESAQVEAEFQKRLYLQGAKDGVSILRALGVLQ